MVKGMSVKLNQQTQSKMEIPVNMAFYVVSKGLAFKKFPGLFDLQEKNGLDTGMQYRTDKKCKEFKHSICGAAKNVRGSP